MEILEVIAYFKGRLLSDYHDIGILLEDERIFNEINRYDSRVWIEVYNYIFFDHETFEGKSTHEIRDAIFVRAKLMRL